MKLYLNDVSPYARWVNVVLHELALSDSVEYIQIDPWDTNNDLTSTNPAGKIPALVTDDGQNLSESHCICQYLIQHTGDVLLWPDSQHDPLLKFQLLGLGLSAIDCAFSAVIQQRFTEGENTLSQRWLNAIPRIAESIEALLKNANTDRPMVNLATLCITVAFSYIEFRLPQINWQSNAPLMKKLVEQIQARPSFIRTGPSNLK
jgi:glutathione S-transferase